MTRSNSAGFILLYVVVMLLAIGMLLFGLQRIQSPSPLFVERQILQSVQRREGQLLLDFVEAGLRQQDLAADPRYLQFKRLVASNSTMPSEMEDQLRWLQAALAQMKFTIDIGRGKGAPTTGPTQQSAPLHEGKGILFQPRKEPFKLKLGDIEYTVRITPVNALPNLNSIPYSALWRYLNYLKIPENEAKDLAAALVDWRDEDDLSTEGRGAESDYYRGLRPAYATRNAPIRGWQELNYVRGVTPDRVALLRDNLMLGLPDSLRLLPDFVAPEAFAAIAGLKPGTIRAILKQYGKLQDNQPEDRSILLGADADAFDRVVAWKMDISLLRIQVTSPESMLTAEYDAARKRITAWW